MTVDDGKVSTTILNLYEQGIAVEPSGVKHKEIKKNY